MTLRKLERFLRDRVLTADFFHELLAFTSSVESVNEQGFITQFLRDEDPPASLELVTPLFKFQVDFFNRAPWYEQLGYPRDTRILHYAGPKKPWGAPPARSSGLGNFISKNARREAESYMGALPDPG